MARRLHLANGIGYPQRPTRQRTALTSSYQLSTLKHTLRINTASLFYACYSFKIGGRLILTSAGNVVWNM